MMRGGAAAAARFLTIAMPDPQVTAPSESPIMEVIGLTKSFGDQAVLRGVDLQIATGQVTVIIGGSGSGKSVLVKHLVGLLRPDSGQVKLHGQDLFAM